MATRFNSVKRRRPTSVVDEIWRQLRRRILHGKLSPGTRLVELDIASQTGASQGSVREALQRLEGEGLVMRRGRTGTFVTEVVPDEMAEIFLIRSLVESLAARQIARSVTPAQLDELRAIVTRMRAAGETGDLLGLVEHDMAFHGRLLAWADHPMLVRVWTLLYAQIERFLTIHDPLHFADLTEIADGHIPVIEALASHDPDAAAASIERHIRVTMEGTHSLPRE